MLRPKPDSNRKAKLIEIISSGTRETGSSAKRKKGIEQSRRWIINKNMLIIQTLKINSGIKNFENI